MRIKKAWVIAIPIFLFSCMITDIRSSEEEARKEAERKALKEAVETLRDLSSARVKEIAGLLEKGKKYYLRGEFRKAIIIFRQVLTKDPENKIALGYIAKAKEELEQEEERGIRKEKKDTRRSKRIEAQKERLAKVHLQRAERYYKSQKLKLAVKELEKALSIHPENIEAQGKILKVKGELEKEETAVENEKKAGSLIERGIIYFRQGEYNRAIEVWQKVLNLVPGNHPDYDRAESCIHTAEVCRIKQEQKDAISRKDISERSAIAGVTESWIRPRRKKAKVEEEAAEEEEVAARTRLEEKAKQIVSVHFENAHIRSVLRYLSEISGVNIVLDESVFPSAGEILEEQTSPRVTIDLDDLPLIEALTVILRAKNLAYRMEENLIWITTHERMARERLVTKIYILLTPGTGVVSFGEPEEEEKEEEEVGGRKFGEEGEEAGRAISAETVLDTLKAAASWPHGSIILFDERTGTLIVRNTPTNLAVLEELIRQIEAVTMQVSIEAKFITVGTNDLRQLGIEYPYLQVGLSGKGQLDINRDAGYGISLPYLVEGDNFTSGEGLALSYTKLKPTEFRMLIDAIEKTGSTDLLSAPKVTTRNQQEAVLKVVEERIFADDYEPFYFVYYADWDGDGIDEPHQGASAVPTSFAEPAETGIKLTVSPDIGSDMNITLSVHAVIDEFLGWETYGAMGVGETGDITFLQLEKIHSRDINTQVVVGDGETIVLGGLIEEEESETVSKTPFFGDIPILGRLFKRTATVSEKRSLLIFITTDLVKPTGERYRG